MRDQAPEVQDLVQSDILAQANDNIRNSAMAKQTPSDHVIQKPQSNGGGRNSRASFDHVDNAFDRMYNKRIDYNKQHLGTPEILEIKTGDEQ